MTKLEKFLRDNDAYEAFVKNLNDIECYGSIADGGYESADDYFETSELDIDGAFIWRLTPQGCDYWGRLNDAYDELLCND